MVSGGLCGTTRNGRHELDPNAGATGDAGLPPHRRWSSRRQDWPMKSAFEGAAVLIR
jgi:hypothetical protein